MENAEKVEYAGMGQRGNSHLQIRPLTIYTGCADPLASSIFVNGAANAYRATPAP